jgi:four helix bundle protein
VLVLVIEGIVGSIVTAFYSADCDFDFDFEHRSAEHEHEHGADGIAHYDGAVCAPGLWRMARQFFDHERLDVYRLAIAYVACSFEASRSLGGLHRYAREQWLRAAQSIPLNIAEGNGKRSRKDRARFLDIARGSALECAAIQDVLLATSGMTAPNDAAMKAMLLRIVAMLTRMAMSFPRVAEPTGPENNVGSNSDHKSEHELPPHDASPEPDKATEKS